MKRLSDDPTERLAECRGDAVPPAGDVEVVGYAGRNGLKGFMNNGIEVDVILKKKRFYDIALTPLENVTRLTAERDALKAEVERLKTAALGVWHDLGHAQSELTKAREFEAERDGLLAEVERLKRDVSIFQNEYVRHSELENAQSDLTKARDALERMVEYFPEGHSDGECFSIEVAKAVLAHQSAPAAKCETCDGTGHDLNGGLNPSGGAADCLDCGGRGTAAKGVCLECGGTGDGLDTEDCMACKVKP